MPINYNFFQIFYYNTFLVATIALDPAAEIPELPAHILCSKVYANGYGSFWEYVGIVLVCKSKPPVLGKFESTTINSSSELLSVFKTSSISEK